VATMCDWGLPSVIRSQFNHLAKGSAHIHKLCIGKDGCVTHEARAMYAEDKDLHAGLTTRPMTA
jgi:hypothetical protein